MAFQQFPKYWENTPIISQIWDEIGFNFNFPRVSCFCDFFFPMAFQQIPRNGKKIQSFPNIGLHSQFYPKMGNLKFFLCTRITLLTKSTYTMSNHQFPTFNWQMIRGHEMTFLEVQVFVTKHKTAGSVNLRIVKADLIY